MLEQFKQNQRNRGGAILEVPNANGDNSIESHGTRHSKLNNYGDPE